VDGDERNGCEVSESQVCEQPIVEDQDCTTRGAVCWKAPECLICTTWITLTGDTGVGWLNELDYCRRSVDPECPLNTNYREYCPEADLGKFCIYTLPGYKDMYLKCEANGWIDWTSAYPDGPPQ
jgi:hypothetical protein